MVDVVVLQTIVVFNLPSDSQVHEPRDLLRLGVFIASKFIALSTETLRKSSYCTCFSLPFKLSHPTLQSLVDSGSRYSTAHLANVEDESTPR